MFPILLTWRRALGRDVTGWAGQVEADGVENLPQEVTEAWGPGLRLDTMPGVYVKVSDYRDHEPPAAVTTGPHVLMR
ncbi:MULTISPECIES: hypothetical protein [unclassified Streptomyces]|uniref:hypothetical protein n=1 Tax=unclassified Streptomyces TaxID=2593676 RepID=UPI003D9075F7